MQYTTLGDTDIRISRIALGTMTWGLQNTAQEAFAQMDYALDQGVQFWDTAEMYAVPKSAKTYGTTETIIGQWFALTRCRAEVVLATKFSPLPWARGKDLMLASKQSLPMAVDASLRRLQTDYIDLYQLHWAANRPFCHGVGLWDYSPPQQKGDRQRIIDDLHETLDSLTTLVQQGKIRHIGLSNDTAWGMMQFLRLAEQHDLSRIVSLQNEYNLLRRTAEMDIAETCAIEGISFLSWSPLAMGILSGKYLDSNLPEGSRFSQEIVADQWHVFATRFDPEVEAPLRAYIALANKYSVDVCQMAIKFSIREPYLSSTIIGATNLAQLANDIAAIDCPMTEEMLKDIAQIRRQYPMPF